jgi:hypothetical protein
MVPGKFPQASSEPKGLGTETRTKTPVAKSAHTNGHPAIAEIITISTINTSICVLYRQFFDTSRIAHKPRHICRNFLLLDRLDLIDLMPATPIALVF